MMIAFVGETMVFEIWKPNLPTDMRPVASMFVRAAAKFPGVALGPSIGGYESDPRELLDIPEAMAVIREFCHHVAALDPAATLEPRLIHESRVLMQVACGVLRRDQINITGRPDVH